MKAYSYESQDCLGLSIVVLVVPCLVFHSVSSGMPIVEGGFFLFFPNGFSKFVHIIECLNLYL